MTHRRRRISSVVAAALVLALSPCCRRGAAPPLAPAGKAPAANASSLPAGTPAACQGFLWGRVTTTDGAVYEGRLLWADGEEAFWGDHFNGFLKENPWAAFVAPGRLPRENRTVELFGIELSRKEGPADLRRPFLTRLGDIARIDTRATEVDVTLKAGTVFTLDRSGAGDIDDGLRVWPGEGGAVDIPSGRIRAIEFLPAGVFAAPPERLHGSVHTASGVFTGFLQWDRWASVGSDELSGTGLSAAPLRFDALRAVARSEGRRARLTLRDGREIELADSGARGDSHHGVTVDDPRWGRVLIAWDTFERMDLDTPEDCGPAYGDFAPGKPLMGTVTARDGRRRTGRLVFDLDESETTQTLDAPSGGVTYFLPFGGIASIALPAEAAADGLATVTLRNGETLQLERSGDLGARNAGLLVFVAGRDEPEYLPWSDVARIELDP